MPKSLVLLTACLGIAGACGATGDADDARPRDLPPAATGELGATFEGQSFTLKLGGLPAKIALRHRLVAAGSSPCALEVALSVARADGSCRLELVYRPWIGAGLRLEEARFHARDAADPAAGRPAPLACAGWPDEPLVDPDEPVVYKLHAGASTLPRPFLPVALAQQAEGLVRAVFLSPAGAVTLKFQGRKFELDTATLVFAGDARSLGVQAESCGPCAGPACESPYPKWQLKDVQTKSKGFGMTYGLEVFSGAPLLVMLGAGWCSVCVTQSGRLQAMQDELRAAGKEVHMAIVNIANSSDPSLQKNLIQKCSFPIFQDTSAVDAFAVMGGQKDDFFLYHSDGTLLEHMVSVRNIAGADSPGYLRVRNALLSTH